jgi:hypothetical protein
MKRPSEPSLFPIKETDPGAWISIRLAARLHGLTEAAVEAFIATGKVRVTTINRQRSIAEADVERAVADTGRKGASQ